MNIISGIARGMRIAVPKGTIRPAGIMARKSLFDSLKLFNDMIIVDLFAGTGAMGLEAASRGAKEVYFIENSMYHLKFISENITRIKKTGVETEFIIVKTDARNVYNKLSHLKNKKIDIIFADPPYNNSTYFAKTLLLSNIKFNLWAGKALLILKTSTEKSRKLNFQENNLWHITNSRILGQSIFSFFKSKMI